VPFEFDPPLFENQYSMLNFFCEFETSPSVIFPSIFATSVSGMFAFSPHHLKILLFLFNYKFVKLKFIRDLLDTPRKTRYSIS
jgi:hypothetical protein